MSDATLATAPVLEARGLTKTFRQGPLTVPVLHGVDFVVPAAARVAVIGGVAGGPDA